jgi:acyl-CoA thioester hydrolase
MERTDQPRLVSAAGGATVVGVDFPSQKAVELPQWMRDIVS